MVFGWGKKKQEEKHVEEIPQNKEIHLGDIPKTISELNTLRQTQSLSEINRLRNDIEPLINELIKIGEVLEKDDLKIDDIDKHLAVIVVRGKKQVIDIIKKGVVSLPKISSINDAEKMNLKLSLILKKIGDVLGRQTRIIHIFAKKYAVQLKEILEVMNTSQSEIDKLLRDYNSTKSLSKQILDMIDQVQKLTQLHKEKLEKSKQVDKQITDTQNTINSMQKEIDEIKISDEYKRYLTIESSFQEFSLQKSKIKDQINTQFTKISRPLSRYEYTSSLDKQQKNILSILVREPFDVIGFENKDVVITILENVRKGVLSGSISVKDIDKTSSLITETEESLDGFAKQISEYNNKYEQMQNEIALLKPKNLDSIVSAHTKNTVLIDECHNKINTLQEEREEIDSKIPKLITEIEQKLRQFSNTRYTVVTSS